MHVLHTKGVNVLQYIGTSLPIHDSVGKATGGAKYAGDMTVPGMLHLALLTSEIPHGIVRAVNCEKALAVPEVVDVLHCFNTTQRRFNRYRNIHGQKLSNQERVFDDKIRLVGDRIACVIAETPQAAQLALSLIEVDIDPLPFATDAKTALESGILADIHPEGDVYPVKEMIMGGEVPDLSGTVITQTGCRLERHNHVTMETQACLADYDRCTGQVSVFSPNQSVHGLRTVLADLFEIPYHKLRVVKTTMGGSFGSKQEWMCEPVAVAAALHTGRPVRLSFTREQAMLSTITRCAMDGTVSSHAAKDGKILSIDLDVTVDAGAYLSNSQDYAAVICSKLFRFYTFPHARYNARAVCTNSPVSGAFRGWGTPELFMMLEHHFNTLAKDLHLDPTDIRLKNAALPGDIDVKTGQTLGEIRAGACIELGREKFDWFGKKEAIKTFNVRGGRFRRGIGVGCGGHGNSYFPRREDFVGVEMRMAEDGCVLVNMTVHDHGCGTLVAMRMIIAETLELPIEQISLGEGDTDKTPLDVGCFASRTTYVTGRAAMDCANKLKDELIARASLLLNIPAGQLEAANGVVSPRNGGNGLSFGEIAAKSMHTEQREVFVSHQYISKSNPGVTGAHFAQVEVDTYTGMVEIQQYLAVQDIGRVINREITAAQVQGAVAIGAGCALTEAMMPDKSGKFTASLKDYHLRNCPEVPTVQIEFIEDGSIDGPYGAKSIGELAIVPVVPAIVGAVNDALGANLNHLPLTPDRIVAHLANGGIAWN